MQKKKYENNINELLLKSGMRKDYIANSMGKDKNWLWRVSTGRQKIGAMEAIFLARIFDVPIDAIFLPITLTKREDRGECANQQDRISPK